jgi:hypothetical protein
MEVDVRWILPTSGIQGDLQPAEYRIVSGQRPQPRLQQAHKDSGDQTGSNSGGGNATAVVADVGAEVWAELGAEVVAMAAAAVPTGRNSNSTNA